MEIIPEGRNFRLVSEHELPAVAKVLEQYFPESLKFHQTIQIYLKNRVWDFNFYVSKNWPEDPVCIHFPGVTGTTYPSVAAFCPSERSELVDLVASDDILLNLSQPLYMQHTHAAIVNRFKKYYEIHGSIIADMYICEVYPKETEDNDLPANVELVQLRPEHVKTVYDFYPAKDVESRQLFQNLFAKIPGYGIIIDGQLVSWNCQSYFGAMFSMRTLPEFQRKGLAINVFRKLSREVIARGYKPFCIIRPGNDASRIMSNKIGFEKCFRTYRTVLHPR